MLYVGMMLFDPRLSEVEPSWRRSPHDSAIWEQNPGNKHMQHSKRSFSWAPCDVRDPNPTPGRRSRGSSKKHYKNKRHQRKTFKNHQKFAKHSQNKQKPSRTLKSSYIDSARTCQDQENTKTIPEKRKPAKKQSKLWKSFRLSLSYQNPTKNIPKAPKTTKVNTW